MILLKIIFMLGLGIYGVWGYFNSGAFVFINGVNLLFHEAGHVFFGFLGQTMGIWGGTLTQLLIPLGIGIGFLMRSDKFSACVMFLWFGQNFSHISVYIKDSRAQILQYVGGEIHDWHFILTKAGLLEQDQIVGNVVWGLGLLIILLTTFSGVLFLARLKREVS